MVWREKKAGDQEKILGEQASPGLAWPGSTAANQERDDTEIPAPATPEDPPEQCAFSHWLILAESASARPNPGTIFPSWGRDFVWTLPALTGCRI
jgi:hypothetical protein